MNIDCGKILEETLPQWGTKLLIAVSGGCDSMFLLQQVMSCNKWPLRVFHLDHQLREESAQDAQLVREYCQYHTIDVDIESCDIAALAIEQKKSIETCARDYRYQRLQEIATERQIEYILTAHHQDDQVETILMHIFRGSSVYGHAGMAVQRQMNNVLLVRPFLQLSRKYIRAQAAQLQIPWREDVSNQDTAYRRNYFRHSIVPDFEAACPGFSEQLLEWSNNESQRAQAYEEFIDAHWHGVQEAEELRVSLCATWSLEQRSALWRRALLSLTLPLSRVYIRQLDNLIRQKNAKKFILGSYCFTRNRESISWHRESQDHVLPVDMPLSPECLYNGFRYSMHDVPLGVDPSAVSSDEALVDGDKIIGELSLRSIRVGEMWQAYGAPGHKKILKYLSDKHLPAQQRRTVLLFADEAGAVWIPGYTIAERVKLDSHTQSCIMLSRVKTKSQGQNE